MAFYLLLDLAGGLRFAMPEAKWMEKTAFDWKDFGPRPSGFLFARRRSRLVALTIEGTRGRAEASVGYSVVPARRGGEEVSHATMGICRIKRSTEWRAGPGELKPGGKDCFWPRPDPSPPTDCRGPPQQLVYTCDSCCRSGWWSTLFSLESEFVARVQTPLALF